MTDAPPTGLSLEDRKTVIFTSALVTKRNEKLRICFICCAKAMSLPIDDPEKNNPSCKFYGSAQVSRHYSATHLQHLDPDRPILCPLCTPKTLLFDVPHSAAA